MKKIFLPLCAVSFCFAFGQVGYWPNDTAGKDHSLYALKNITLYKDYKTRIEHAAILYKDGKIIDAGNIAIPQNAVVTDGKNATVYPSFIEPYSNLGFDSPAAEERFRGGAYEPKNNSAAYNDAIHANTRAADTYANSGKDQEDFLADGFGAVLAFGQDGIVQGTAVLAAPGKGNIPEKIIKEDAALMMSFEKGASRMAYPTSLGGAIALIRQLYLDSDWYDKGGSPEKNQTLSSFSKYKKLPTIFRTKDKWDILRADKIGDEAGVQMIFLGSGNEYQRSKEIKAAAGTVILPLEYPKPFDVQDVLDGNNLEVADLKHWELAPYNAVFLDKEQVPYTFTTYNLKDKKTFLKKIRELKDKGISEEKLLEALTARPAQMLHVSGELGVLQKGARANFIICSGDIFNKDSVIYENWVLGKQYVINEMPAQDIRGEYALNLNGQNYTLKIKGTPIKPEAEVLQQDKKGKAKIAVSDYKMALNLKLPNDSLQNYRIFYPVSDFKNSHGVATDNAGNQTPYSIAFTKEYIAEAEKNKEEKKEEIGKIWYPFNAYGAETLPVQRDYLIKNATVWTNTSAGILKNTDIKVSGGKIVQIGSGISPGNAVVIDGTGKQLTSGIIDEHSHIGLRGVNEAGTNNSAEVRMSDVIEPDDISFYRQLSGGTTLCQQLHGSANPVGGQSSIVKFRWGQNADGLRYQNAPKFIKFALGENVKQSNWNAPVERYPQSRPGVEQTYDFWFTRAQEYQKEKAANPNYRKDLRLEAMQEILDGSRHITCHSYVQSEINMLMNVSDKFHFKVNTFTHILEGYKLVDKLKERGINASTFSDWWAYKEEVREAIPYNAAILLQEGVNTAINSDDAEMGRRLNQEAGKVVKYGGISQEEAWKTVTLNPAKMLHIDDKVGSVQVGKDADLVLWTADPLSTFATVDKTMVDGIIYFDAETQAAKDKAVADEKNRIIRKMLFSDDAKKGETQPVKKPVKTYYECNTVTEGDLGGR